MSGFGLNCKRSFSDEGGHAGSDGVKSLDEDRTTVKEVTGGAKVQWGCMGLTSITGHDMREGDGAFERAQHRTPSRNGREESLAD